MVQDHYDIETFMAALQVELDKSAQREMCCTICGEVTPHRAIAMPPGKPARPAIFAVCEVCRLLPEWEKEASRILSAQFALLLAQERMKEQEGNES